jgi:hypothetical protein
MFENIKKDLRASCEDVITLKKLLAEHFLTPGKEGK